MEMVGSRPLASDIKGEPMLHLVWLPFSSPSLSFGVLPHGVVLRFDYGDTHFLT